MEDKLKYYQAFVQNDGRLNEIELGAIINLNESETRKIIAQLLAEYKIQDKEHGACNYSLFKKSKIRK